MVTISFYSWWIFKIFYIRYRLYPKNIFQVYGRGTGVECRQHVQRLNTLRADLDQQTERVPSLYDRTDPHDNENKQIYRGSQNFHDYDQAEEFSQQNKVSINILSNLNQSSNLAMAWWPMASEN
jgi:hypothetical protein